MIIDERRGRIITFYSYKGGTGRSMALANIACILASPKHYNKKVLLIDWDLEAPGLHRYFQNSFKTQPISKKSIDDWLDEQLGLIDLFWEMKAKLDHLSEPEDEDVIKNFLKEFNPHRFILKTDIANLFLLKAGQFGDGYSEKIHEFSWSELYETVPSLIRLFAEYLKHYYDYILVDSRTGVTDTSGICTIIIPETLVVVFTPNRQSLLGVRGVVEKAVTYRKESIDDIRPLTVFPLPSRIETSEPSLREAWRRGNPTKQTLGYQPEFEKLFKKLYGLSNISLEEYFNEVQIQHLPRYAYGEEIAVLIEQTGDRLSLTRSYQNFAERLVEQIVPWEADGYTVLDSTTEKSVFLPEDFCPYKGLKSFREEDQDLFFGRDKFIKRLLDRLKQEQFLAILGASAIGKSSIVQAGLIPQLKHNDRWRTYYMTPGEHPLDSLKKICLELNLSDEQIEHFLQDKVDGLKKLVQAIRNQAVDIERIILIVDQLEEVFILCQNSSERNQFFKYLLDALKLTPILSIVVVVQSDFLARGIEREYSELQQKIESNLFIVPQMDEEELREAIVKPAARVNLLFEPELVDSILEDMKDSSNSLPLLQYTLKKLWENRTGNIVLLKTYSQLGGIKGSLEEQATRVYESLSDSEKKVAKHIFLSLTQLGEGTEVTRKRVLKKDLITTQFSEELIDKVLQKLSYEGLISLKINPLKSSSQNLIDNRSQITRTINDLTANLSLSNIGQAPETATAERVEVTVEVIHEALIRQWIKLKEWLEENRENIKQQGRIENLAKEWRDNDKNSDYLLTGIVLREAQQFQRNRIHEYSLSNVAQEFIEKSNKYQNNKNRLRLTSGLLILVPILYFALGYSINKLNLINLKNRILNCTNSQNCPTLRADLEELSRREKIVEALNIPADANLSNGNFVNVSFPNANFSNANLQAAIFFGAELIGANFTKANLPSSNFQWAILIGADLSGAILQDAILQSAIMSDAKLKSANLESADLSRASLRNANSQKANLKDTNLRRADLEEADFTGANLSGTYLQRANLDGTILVDTIGLITAQIKSACNWEKAKYKLDPKANDLYIKQLRLDKDSNPKPDCSIWQ